MEVIVVRHIDYEGQSAVDNVRYTFFKGRNKFFSVPWKAILFTKKEKPDFVIIQGAIFPFQTIITRMLLPDTTRIIVQHHGNLPFGGVKKTLQRLADRCTDAYIFTALGNAKMWLDKKIINRIGKCFEVLEASSYLTRQNKQESRARLKIKSDNVFLWVGRLDADKDPVTVIKGFEMYLQTDPSAELYMVYQSQTILSEVVATIGHNNLLKNAVYLVGKIQHEALATWFSAADYYLSGSTREAAGYALLEAMACGCIPIVTDIPPFRKITGNYGFLFPQGSPDSLFRQLVGAAKVEKEAYSTAVVEHFKKELSFEKIADDIFNICKALSVK